MITVTDAFPMRWMPPNAFNEVVTILKMICVILSKVSGLIMVI